MVAPTTLPGLSPSAAGGPLPATLLAEIDLIGNRRGLASGGVLQLVPGVVHDVIYQSDQPATSIHVYSPPLTEMTYYDTDTWEADETVHVDHEQPVLSGWHGANLLHPARRRPS